MAAIAPDGSAVFVLARQEGTAGVNQSGTVVRFDVAGRFRAVYLHDWKLIWTPGATGDAAWQLYDLAHDPAEETNLYAADHARVPALRSALTQWLSRASEFEAAPETGAIGAEDARRLRELGYTGDD